MQYDLKKKKLLRGFKDIVYKKAISIVKNATLRAKNQY